MLKKILSNLPFNPSLINDLPFYTAKLKRQYFIRSVGLVILFLALIVEIFTISFPAQPSLPYSPNDLLKGGFSSITQASSDCSENVSNFGNVLGYFGISCSDLNSANTQTITLNQFKNGSSLIGRLPFAQKGGKSVSINHQVYWLRPVYGTTYSLTKPTKALVGESSNGSQFIDLYNSADLILYNKSLTQAQACRPSKCPSLSLSVINHTQNTSGFNLTAKPGDDLIYFVAASNGSDQPINNYAMNLSLSNALAYAHLTNSYGGSLSGGSLSWPSSTLAPGQTIANQFTMHVDQPLPNTPESSTDSSYYNLTFTSVYGDTVSIKLPTSFIKKVELSNLNLPYLSPVSSLIIIIIFFLVTAYFQLRSALFLRQLRDLRHNYNRDNL